MNLLWATAGALTGCTAGAVLRGPAFRLAVPSGEADRTACPRCAAPLPRWVALRCHHCGQRPGPPLAMELLTALVLALVAASFPGQPELAAFGFLGALGVALAAVDVEAQRLPDRLTLPAYPVLIALLTIAAAITGDPAALSRAILGGMALSAFYLLLALARPGQLGGGDIKLAGLAGLVLGWLGWVTLIAGAALGFLLSAVVTLPLLAARRITLRSQLSFGPFLLGGALLAMIISGPKFGGHIP